MTTLRSWKLRSVMACISVLLLILCTVLNAGAFAVQPVFAHGAIPASSTTPVLFVHGFNGNGSIPGGCNGSTTWGTAKSYLSSHGFTGPLITIGFYSGDTNCDVNLVNQQNSHCNNYYAGNTGTINEDQRHIACTLDWYIWNSFSQYGQNVEIVTHSMGGTIARWAIYAIGQSFFAVSLYVHDVVTIAAPHNGIPWGGSIVCGICLQLAELQPGSSFLSTLQHNAQNPQASNGTTWTIFGSTCENWFNGSIDPSSEMGMPAQHKVLYQNPPCYHHGDYLTDASDNLDAHANYCDNACPGEPNNNTGYSTSFPHALREVGVGLSY